MELQRVGQASLPQMIKTLYTCQTVDRGRSSRSILDNKSPLCIKDKQKRGDGVETGLTSVAADMEVPARHLKKVADVDLLRLIHIALDRHCVQPRLSAHYSLHYFLHDSGNVQNGLFKTMRSVWRHHDLEKDQRLHQKKAK